MTALTKEQIASSEKTLLTAFLLSVSGPLVTGIAVFSSHSTILLADFIRRTAELVALFISWWIFCQIHRKAEPAEADQAKLERIRILLRTEICSAICKTAVVKPVSNW